MTSPYNDGREYSLNTQRKHGIRMCIWGATLTAVILLTGCVPIPPLTPTPAPTATLTPPPTATFTLTPEPLVPTPLPTAIATVAATATPALDVTGEPSATIAATAQITPNVTPTESESPVSSRRVPEDGRARIGVGLALGEITDYPWEDGLPGWYLAWQVKQDPPLPGDIRFVQMVSINGDRYYPDLPAILTAVHNNPGSLWLIGNEPDVKWQGNATPEQYAAIYGPLYHAIKEADPTAQVAIGGVSQPTPLRIEYIERILAAYEAQYGEPMPVDVWNIHAFILREERDSWGVDIPPGMDDVDTGTLYEIADHADMAIFRRQIEDFRRWMAEKGFRDKPLLVSEYSILMPESYGFPPDLVSQFMVDTFDYLLTATDAETGYPADDNRLVQALCWYSVGDPRYPTPNLFDPELHTATPLGEVFQAYVAGLR
jgi:hypothetical protein